jgi:hypothetical protein
LLLLTLPAQAAVEVAGTRFDERMKVGADEAVINGAGVRGVLFIKAYAMALYLPQKSPAAADVLAMKGSKRIRIIPLRKITAEQFADALISGIRKNHDDAGIAPLAQRIETFNTTLAAIGASNKGAVIDLDWLPSGNDGVTRLSVGGEKKGADIPGGDFYHALLKIWIGEHPIDKRLMNALLGIAEKSP